MIRFELNGLDPAFQQVLWESLGHAQPAPQPGMGGAAARVHHHAPPVIERANPPQVVNDAIPVGGLNAEGVPNIVEERPPDREPRPDEVVDEVGDRPWLINNLLSWLWTPQGRKTVGNGFYCLFPFTYAFGVVGYALSLVTRVAELAIKLIKLIGTFLAFAFTCGHAMRWFDVKKRAIVFLGGLGLVVSAAIGCACPIAAYRIDEAIESNKTVHRYSTNIWNHEFFSDHRAIKSQYQELADEIESAEEYLEEIWTDWGTLMPNELDAKCTVGFAAMYLKNAEGKLPPIRKPSDRRRPREAREIVVPDEDMLTSLKNQLSDQTILTYLALHLAEKDLVVGYAPHLAAAKADLASKGLTNTFAAFQKCVSDIVQFFTLDERPIYSALVNNTF
jgi:hypothetical protein